MGLHHERCENPITLKTDLQGAFPNSHRAAELDNCLKAAPCLAGCRASMHAESPIASILEEHEGALLWKHCHVQGGAVQGDLLEPVTFPLHMAAARARNNATSETTTQSDGGVAMNEDETTCNEVADMFQACKEAAAKWGGVCSPTKTEVLIPAGLQGEHCQ